MIASPKFMSCIWYPRDTEEKFYDMTMEDPKELELLKQHLLQLGSVRYKLVDPDVDDTDYRSDP